MILPGNVLKRARETAGLTQAELAQRLGSTQPVVARLESGRANPRLDTFQRAIAATGHRLTLDLQPAGWPAIDETMIKEALRRSPAERVRDFEGSYRGVRSLAEKALRGRGP